MKYVASRNGELATVELSRRNLETLLKKLDDPKSSKTLIKQEDEQDGDEFIVVKAVEDSSHYENRAPGIVYMPSSDSFYY